MKFNKVDIINSICPPLHSQLAEQLIDEFVSIQNRYMLRDWEPATLDGGQFCEVAARIIYHQDSNVLNLRKSVNSCLTFVEDPQNNNIHHYPNRKSSLHTAKVIRTIYKFRSDRGAVHIDPNYNANQVDSRLVLENAQWILSEIMRVFWNSDRDQVVIAIRNLLQFHSPIVGNYEGRLLVLSDECSTEDEILLILHQAKESGLSRSKIGESVIKAPSTISNNLKKLELGRKIIKLSNGNYRLTDLGEILIKTDILKKFPQFV